VVEQWQRERRKITYHDLDILLREVWRGGDLPSPASRYSQSSARKAAQKAVRVQTKLLQDEDLSATLRTSIEGTLTLARRDARRDKLWEEDVPKSPERYLAVSAAEWILLSLQPHKRHSKLPIPITSYKGKGGRSTQLPETYSPLIRIATALHWNEPVTPQHCWQMVKVCDKLLELRKRERP
jgi:hypothetical protein